MTTKTRDISHPNGKSCKTSTALAVFAALVTLIVSQANAESSASKLLTGAVTQSEIHESEDTHSIDISDDNASGGNKLVNKIRSWLYPAICLKLPATEIMLGKVTTSHWKNWLDSLKLDTVSSLEFLSVGIRADQQGYLRQTLIPTDKGSPRVSATATLKPRRTYRIKQSIYLEPEFDWGRKLQGGKIGFGFGGGSAPTGGSLAADGFTARFMWRGNGDGSAHLAVYSYSADRIQNLPYGDDHPLTGFDVPIGQWFELLLEVSTNSNVEQADGTLKAWVNGKLLASEDSILWQSEGLHPKIDKLMFSTFYGGASLDWAPAQPTHIRFADVCWAPVLDGFSALSP